MRIQATMKRSVNGCAVAVKICVLSTILHVSFIQAFGWLGSKNDWKNSPHWLNRLMTDKSRRGSKWKRVLRTPFYCAQCNVNDRAILGRPNIQLRKRLRKWTLSECHALINGGELDRRRFVPHQFFEPVSKTHGGIPSYWSTDVRWEVTSTF